MKYCGPLVHMIEVKVAETPLVPGGYAQFQKQRHSNSLHATVTALYRLSVAVMLTLENAGFL